MHDLETVISAITAAFSSVEYPGDWCLRGSNEGDEPYLLEKEFKGKSDWRKLDSKFLDQAPDGYGSALSFFSDEAFRFYLPAYLIADLREQLERSNPSFQLTHGLDNSSRHKEINPRRYGERTWFEHARHKFAIFDQKQTEAIINYLEIKKLQDEFSTQEIDEALNNYWRCRSSNQ